jgi:hypothetical protein
VSENNVGRQTTWKFSGNAVEILRKFSENKMETEWDQSGKYVEKEGKRCGNWVVAGDIFVGIFVSGN